MDIDIYKYLWIFTDVYRYLQIFTDIYRYLQIFIRYLQSLELSPLEPSNGAVQARCS